MRGISVVGVPDSAGSYAAGQDQAPAALRSAGLIEALAGTGVALHDEGDLPKQIWRPDRDHPRAQNVNQVTACVQELADRLQTPLERGDMVVVLGGNCTIVLGVVAALRRMGTGPPGLLYVDRHYDINTPLTTTDGALDWMGLAHALGLPGGVDELVDAFGSGPLLEAHQVAWLGVDPNMTTEWERQQHAVLSLQVTSSEELAADPAGAASIALSRLPPGPLAVHFDVDVLDFTDAPLAENTDGRNTGPTLDQAADALLVAAHDQRLRALSIGELNPTRSAGDPCAIPRFVRTIARVIAAQVAERDFESGS